MVSLGMDMQIQKDSWIPTQNGNECWTPPNTLKECARVFELVSQYDSMKGSGNWT